MWTAALDSAGGRWRRQHRAELDGDEWSVVYDTLVGTVLPCRAQLG